MNDQTPTGPCASMPGHRSQRAASDAIEACDEGFQDEPLASGQRKRYLASLGAGMARG